MFPPHKNPRIPISTKHSISEQPTKNECAVACGLRNRQHERLTLLGPHAPYSLSPSALDELVQYVLGVLQAFRDVVPRFVDDFGKGEGFSRLGLVCEGYHLESGSESERLIEPVPCPRASKSVWSVTRASDVRITSVPSRKMI